MNVLTTPMPIALVRAGELVTPALRATVDALCPAMARVAGYHHGWLDQLGQPTGASGGKLLRPALALQSALAAGHPATAAMPAAVAVELVHNFSLLHDDIMDGDIERRHRPTAWTVFGVGQAILAGDALLTAAMELLLDQQARGAAAAAKILAHTTQRLIEGQSDDLSFESRPTVAVAECLTMAANKTAALLNCAASIGAVLVGAPAELSGGLGMFGEHLGTAFQLVDDLLGIWGDPEQTGKPVYSDLRAGKKSLPIVAALATDGPASRALRERYRNQDELGDDDLVVIAGLVEEAGGRQWAEHEAGQRIARAADLVSGLNMADEARHNLLAIADFVTARKH
jgi:geranylgeranyl diphosphate synthase type I